MKLNFDFTMVGLNGEPLKDGDGIELHAGRTAAGLLMQSTDTADIMTRFDWANQLHKTGIVDLDKAGQAQFRRAIETLPNIWLIVRARILEVLENRQDELQK
jgi:hypothetical protein